MDEAREKTDRELNKMEEQITDMQSTRWIRKREHIFIPTGMDMTPPYAKDNTQRYENRGGRL